MADELMIDEQLTPVRRLGRNLDDLTLLFLIFLTPVGVILAHVLYTRAKQERDPYRQGRAAWMLVAGYAVCVAAAVAIVVNLVNQPPSGYNNIAKLQTSVRQQLNAHSHGLYWVKDVACVHRDGTQYQCVATNTDGSGVSMSVTVASNGQTWVSNGS